MLYASAAAFILDILNLMGHIFWVTLGVEA